MQDFAGKVAVVTGAASGMGKAFADRFARAGMKVVLADVEQDALDLTVKEFRQREHDVVGVRTDVSNSESVDQLAQEALSAYGKVHILCNNAGVLAVGDMPGLGTAPRHIWEQSLKDWQWTLGVNLYGVINGIRSFVPQMLKQDEEGHIVNTASVAGLTSGGALAIYGASKHAVVRLSEALYQQLGGNADKIGVSVLCPGGVDTRIASAGRNRPDQLLDEGITRPTAGELAQREAQRAARPAGAGMAPEQVADQVFQAIQDRQFYIITHDEYDQAIRGRMEDILTRRNPSHRPW